MNVSKLKTFVELRLPCTREALQKFNEEAPARKRQATQQELDQLIAAGEEHQELQTRESVLTYRIQELFKRMREARTLEEAWNCVVGLVGEVELRAPSR